MLDNPAVLISLGVSVASAIGFIWAIKSSVAVLDTRLAAQDKVINEIQAEMKVLARVVTDLAVQSQRMSTIEERALSQGKRLDEALNRFNKWIDRQVA